ncbi:glycosyltransferase family 2 protein [Vibrio cyclitrophicus]|uniref:glycosyltransferase family 2 protein n=1 Tax=Vibrio cyclitrophicus TaxID=47951 RepID=UPI0038B5BCB0
MYTIIIANYNRTTELKRCLDSIDLAFNGFVEPEVIVVEDGSEKVLKDSRISQHIKLAKNGGPVRARLSGVENTKFEYVILLDSDDTLLPEAVTTVESVKKSNLTYDLYGFTYEGGESSIDFKIKSLEDYCNFATFEDWASDYMIVIKASVFKKFVKTHSFRISEIWLFSEIFKHHTAFYSQEPIFKYHQDAQEQLSKKRNFHFKYDKYERESVSKSVEYFTSFILTCKSNSLRNAWRRRLIKESILYFNIRALWDMLCLKK